MIFPINGAGLFPGGWKKIKYVKKVKKIIDFYFFYGKFSVKLKRCAI